MTKIPSQEDLRSILSRLLEAEIAEDDYMPCKATTLRASAILSLNSYCMGDLTEEQNSMLSKQSDYV